MTIEDEVSFRNKYSLIVADNHSGTLNRSHYWANLLGLSSTYITLVSTLAMATQFLMLKKIWSTILHHTSFVTAKVKFFAGFLQFCKGVLPFQALSLGVTTPHITPEFSLLSQFSGITTLQSLVLEKQCKGA